MQATNAGLYSVVVTNVAGSVTSSPVNLDVDPTFTKITAGAVVSAPAFWPTFAWGDYDNDGFLDLFVVNQDWDVGRPVANFLFHNLHDGSFERVTNNTVATDRCFGISGTWGDFDNDGNLDLFVANAQTSLGFSSNTNCLYRNLGNGVFTQITTGPPLNTKNVGNGMWVDYDNDGNLDLFLFKWYGGVGTRTNNLFRNDGDGRFTEVSAGPAQTVGSGNCAGAWGDYDNDGRPDLAIWAFQKSMLCHNEGYGKFSSVTNGFTRNTDYINKLAWADYDNDGRLDLLGVGYGSWGPHAPNHILFHNQGQGQFNTMVLGSYDTNAFCLCSAWGDYDNDGYLDLFVIQGFGQATRNLLFHNNGNGTFTKVTTGSPINEAGDYGTYIAWGACAWADYDNDGFLDLLYGSTNGLHLYHNNGNTNHWLTLDLAGTASNRSAIGAKARVKATIGGKTFWQLREVSTGDGFAQGDMRPHFGLGDASLAETVRIEWPSGIVQELQNVAANQFLRITEPPGLRALAASQSSGFQVALTGNVGSRYDLLASTNLLDWTFWQTVTSTNRTTVLTDPAASTASQRFFKAGLHD